MFFHTYGKKTKNMTDEEFGRLVRALIQYSEDGTITDLPDKESVAFDFIVSDIDAGHAKADEVSAKRKKAVEERENKRHQMISNDAVDNTRCINHKPKTINQKLNTSSKEDVKHPTVEEVASYCKERNNSVDAQRFVDYYSSQKWRKANGQPLSDWRAAVRTWEGRDRKDKYHSEGYEQHPITTAQLRDAFVDLSAYD